MPVRTDDTTAPRCVRVRSVLGQQTRQGLDRASAHGRVAVNCSRIGPTEEAPETATENVALGDDLS